MAVEHRFGNPSTELKLEVVESYLRAFTMALRNKWPELWYIDGFAGTGSRVVDFPAREQDLLHEPVAARVERLRGSAQIALEVEPPFKRVIFIEEKPTFCAELERLTSEHKGREIEIWRGEANTEIVEHCHETDWSGKRAVMFLDPYGMEVSLNTLQAIQSTEAIDLWYLFSLEGLYRQAARRMENIDDAKAEAITRMLGTNDWKEALYRPSGQLNFLDEASHAEPLAIYEVLRNSSARGSAHYSLLC